MIELANDINRLMDMIYERIEDAKSPALKPNTVSYTHLLELCPADGDL